jgi:hypothetical protein
MFARAADIQARDIGKGARAIVKDVLDIVAPTA